MIELTVPDEIGASLPRQYVAHLANPSVACIEPVPQLGARKLRVVRTATHLEWTFEGSALRVALAAIEGARLERRTFGPSEFLAFTLIFGETGGGVALLKGNLDTAQWFQEFSPSLQPIIPRGVHVQKGAV